MCQSATNAMHDVFPELRVVRGFCHTYNGKSEHWWLETDNGEVIDPTASQFTNILKYEEYKEGMALRIGRCMNCGDDIIGYSLNTPNRNTCSNECEKDLIDSLR